MLYLQTSFRLKAVTLPKVNEVLRAKKRVPFSYGVRYRQRTKSIDGGQTDSSIPLKNYFTLI